MRPASAMVADVNDRSRWASFDRGDLITDRYLELQRELHGRPRGYGGRGSKWANGVRGLIDRFRATSVLDYGCGEGTLIKSLRPMCDSTIRIDEYDPAIPGKDTLPSFADLVVCTDVLEHIEPDRLDRVLGHLGFLARKAVFVVIATRPSSKTMADGRNAHLILEDADWWSRRVESAGFSIAPDPPVSPSPKPSREWVAVLT